MIAFLASCGTVRVGVRLAGARAHGSSFLSVTKKGSAGSVCNTRTKVWNPILFTAHGD